MAEIIRRHYIFYGRVQGVGFRYRARYLASQYRLTGWVRNLYDGSVEMEAQGRREDIARFIELLNQDRYIRIDNMEVTAIPCLENERGFHTH